MQLPRFQLTLFLFATLWNTAVQFKNAIWWDCRISLGECGAQACAFEGHNQGLP